MFVCLFIGALGRGNIEGHYAPITQIKSSPRGEYHREFDVTDIGKETARLDPDRFISEEMSKVDVGSKEPEMTSTRCAMLWTREQHMCYRKGHTTEGALRPVLAT